MSQYGYLIFYTCRRPSDPRAALLALLGRLEVKSIRGAWRTVGPECGWDILQRNLRAVGDECYTQNTKHFPVRDLGPSDIAALFEEPSYLRIEPRMPLGSIDDRVRVAVETNIASEIRGDYAPNCLYVGAGYRDIFESSEHDGGLYIARAFFTVEFFGYSTPSNWNEMRRLTFQLPEIVGVKHEIEEILGPLEQCMIWDV